MKTVFAAHGNIISSLGFTAKEIFSKMLTGISGVKTWSKPEFLPFPFPASFVDSDRLELEFSALNAKQLYTRLEKMFILSIADVLKNSGSDAKDDRTLLIISTTKGNINLLEEEGYDGFPESRLLLTEMAGSISTFLGFKHTPLVISNACISGVLAIITAQRLIRSGQFDNVIVSGGDLVSAFTLSGFSSFKALSNDPCRPFDVSRKGINLGEGCGTLLLTSNLNFLEKGEKKITIAGGGVSNDANHISGPSRTGEELALAVSNAVNEAGNIETIDFISAHGTATIFNDEMEAKAFSIAGFSDVPLNSMKGYFGHTLGAAGVIEAIITLESMKNDMLLASPGFESSGVPVPLNIITETGHKELNSCLKTASGFGGCNAAVIFTHER